MLVCSLIPYHESLHSRFFTTVTSVKKQGTSRQQHSVRRRHIKILSFLKDRYDKSTRFQISIYGVTFNNIAIPASSAKCIATKNGSNSMEYSGSIAK